MKKNTNFINFGAYRAEEADILKPELEKKGVPVKVLYPGTSVGKELTAGAQWTAYELLIRGCDFPVANDVRKGFNIKPIKEEMPLPSFYAQKPRSKTINRILLFIFLGLFISTIILNSKSIVSTNTKGYIFAFVFLFLFLWLVNLSWQALRNRLKTE